MNSQIKKFNKNHQRELEKSKVVHYHVYPGLSGVPIKVVYEAHTPIGAWIAYDHKKYNRLKAIDFHRIVDNGLIPNRIAHPKGQVLGILTTQIVNPISASKPKEVMRGLKSGDTDFIFLHSNELSAVKDGFIPADHLSPLRCSVSSSKLKDVLVNVKARKGVVVANGNFYWYWKKKDKTHLVTVVTHIRYKVQRTGEIRPTLEIEKLTTNHTSYSNIPLQSCKVLHDLGVGVGTAIMLNVNKPKNLPPSIEKVYHSPHATENLKKCPSCRGDIFEDDHRLFCYNLDCDGRKKAHLNYALSSVLSIRNISDAKVSEISRKYSDIFALMDATEEDLAKLNGFGTTTIRILYNALQNSVRRLTLTQRALVSGAFVTQEGATIPPAKLTQIFKDLGDEPASLTRGQMYNRLMNKKGIGDITVILFLRGINKFLAWEETYSHYSVN